MIQNSSPIIIALCGKGGVGKTSVSAMISKTLSEIENKRTLVIDADPAVGLATALGIEVKKTVNDIRNNIINSITDGDRMTKEEMLAGIDFDILDALAETDRIAFLAVGRPEDEGCYCQLNTFLKEIISRLASKFDYVVIDGEAGIEQINRRVMEMVSHLFLITDTSVKGHKVVEQLSRVAETTIKCREKGILINKIRNKEEIDKIYTIPNLPVFAYIPEDDTVRDFDIAGKSFRGLPACNALDAIETLIEKGILEKTAFEPVAINNSVF